MHSGRKIYQVCLNELLSRFLIVWVWFSYCIYAHTDATNQYTTATARPSPTPGLLRRNTSDKSESGDYRGRGRNQLPTTGGASRQATVSGRVSTGYLVL